MLAGLRLLRPDHLPHEVMRRKLSLVDREPEGDGVIGSGDRVRVSLCNAFDERQQFRTAAVTTM